MTYLVFLLRIATILFVDQETDEGHDREKEQQREEDNHTNWVRGSGNATNCKEKEYGL